MSARFPEEPPSSSSSLKLMPFEGVWRSDGDGEEVIPFDTLFDATREPPMNREAVVRDDVDVLAECLPMPDYRWQLTVRGSRRIEREVRGAA